ncbi:MAG: response regulator receiver protein [Bryobacterales bacterium]|jgi:FixJ family two-component response regulator|nr:response regulator receiver protein [Bryobacterales bacterium]
MEVPRIAVIDDDESVRESVVSLIESVGYDAIFFDSAEDFLNSPNTDRVNCLIVDVRLPGISGLQLYSRIKASARRIRTIFITARIDESACAWAMEAGALAFLYKPFQVKALLCALRIAVAETQT